ncbi:MAG TPA: hypothetical protein DHU67_04765 [Clostridium sp.]|nr:hypothetical protein [Clostridium sp.]
MASWKYGNIFGRYQYVGSCDNCIFSYRTCLTCRHCNQTVEEECHSSVCPVFDRSVFGGDHAVKKNQNGSFTIEASFVVPIILMVFMASVYIIFYFHDKNILSGAAYETAVVGSERKSYKKEELEAYFRRRIKGKLIVFSNVKENIEVEKEEITVTCSAKKRRMKINVSASVKQTEPETYIRNVRKIKK